MLDHLFTILARAVARRATMASLLIGLVALLGYNVDHAGWVAGVQWWPGAWLALVGGAALAQARWKGRWALAYAGALIMAGAAELVGRVVPDLSQLTQAPGDWVVSLHLRTVTLGLRLEAWGTAIARGRPVGDTGLFVWLLALITWGAVAWLAWSTLRRRQAMAGCLPAAVVLAVNTYLSGQPWQEVLLFFVLIVGLIIDATYVGQNADWDRRGVDYPDAMGLDWSLPAIGLTLSLGMLGAVGPLVGTPSGWHLLGDVLATSQQQVTNTANQLFAGVKAPSAGPQSPVARTPDLSNIGAGIDQSQATLMWVMLDEPAPAPYPGAPPPPQHYWRSGVYATYTGAGWQPFTPVASGAAPTAVDRPPPGRYALSQKFEIVAVHGQQQFAINRPISATSGAAVNTDAADADTAWLSGQASTYSVVSFATRASQAELQSAGTDYPAAIRATYLQLPASLPARVASLAAQIASGAGDPYDRALRLQDYLRRTYIYKIDVPSPPAGRDAVDYFLYEAPGGYCSYYASAMAVMLRTLGVPARVATGYAMGQYDSGRGAYRISGADAHAWVEVYFPTFGWVEFEPTPARAVFDRPLGNAAATPTPLAPAAGSGAAGQAGSSALAVVIGLLIAMLGVAGWAWWQVAARRGLRETDSPRQQALRLYGRVRSALARAGLGAPPSVTADEFLQAHAGDLGAYPALLAAMTEVTALFRQAAYSAHPIGWGEAREAAQAWSGARAAWLALALRRFARRLRPQKASR
jgi:transglutaminase-like putative cysteine protease